MFHCLKINQLLAPSGRWCFSHMKGFWVTPSWACVFFQGGEDRQAVSVPEHCQVGRSLFQGGCGEHRGPRGGGPRVSLAGGGWGVESGVQCGHRLGTARSLWCWRQEAGGAPREQATETGVVHSARTGHGEIHAKAFRGVGAGGALSCCRLWRSHVKRLIRRAGC